MPAAPQTGHRLVEDLEIPYVTFDSPIADRPAWEEGINAMTSMRKVLERRPGFAVSPEVNPTTFPGRVNNIHCWRKWSSGLGLSKGNFFIMASVATANKSQVWKMELGVDTNFTMLFEMAGTTNPFSFIDRNNWCFFGCAVEGSMKKYGGTGDNGLPWLLNWGIKGPTIVPICTAVAPSSGTNGINCETDYHYRYTYCHEVIAGESSPSDVNDCIGQFTNMAVQITLKASSDPQVGHIRVYRTRDGGSTDPRQMQEIIGSPFPNADSTVTDRTHDADLHNRFAPGLRRNDPPPPLTGFVSSDSRIFGFNGNMVWFSAYNEIVNGMAEECFPGGETGNFYPFSAPVISLAGTTGDASGCAVFMADKIARIDGDLRAEIRRYTIDILHGTRSRFATYGMGGDVAWFDTSGQMRLSSVGELSQDIRPDAAAMSLTNIYITPHIAATREWLCVLDAASGKLMAFDIDTQKWQVPWPCAATAIHSGEIAEGKRVLIAGIGGQIWYMAEGRFNDRNVPYPAYVKTNLIPISMPNQPDVLGLLDSLTIERNTTNVKDILLNLDEQTSVASAYKSIFIPANEGDPSKRKSGKALVAKRYTIDTTFGAAQRASVRIDWPAEDKNFELYSINVELHPA